MGIPLVHRAEYEAVKIQIPQNLAKKACAAETERVYWR